MWLAGTPGSRRPRQSLDHSMPGLTVGILELGRYSPFGRRRAKNLFREEAVVNSWLDLSRGAGADASHHATGQLRQGCAQAPLDLRWQMKQAVLPLGPSGFDELSGNTASMMLRWWR